MSGTAQQQQIQMKARKKIQVECLPGGQLRLTSQHAGAPPPKKILSGVIPAYKSKSKSLTPPGEVRAKNNNKNF